MGYILLLTTHNLVLACDEELFLHKSMQKVFDLYVALRCKVLRKENAENQDDQSFHGSFNPNNYQHYNNNQPYDTHFDSYMNDDQNDLDQLIIVLTNTYQKIIIATVTYYLMMNLPGQQNLQFTIAQIIVQDIVKILRVISKMIIRFIINPDISNGAKIGYCLSITCIIIAIKIVVDALPDIAELKVDL
ncbi:MAG: hypothetical protein ACXWL2_02260 [Candidatus Chromulinivorax sp.]